MKDIDKISNDLNAWVEEDDENRAITLVAVQKTEDKEDGYRSQHLVITNGIMGYLVDAFQAVLNGKSSEGLRDVLTCAKRRNAMMGLIKVADNLDKMPAMTYDQIYAIIKLYNQYKGNLNDDGTVATDEQITEWIVASIEDSIEEEEKQNNNESKKTN